MQTEFRNNHRKCIDDLFFCNSLFLDEEDGVISCDGSQNLGDVAVVNVVGNAAGISGARAYHAEVAREVDALETWPGRVLITTMLPEKLMERNPVPIAMLLIGIWLDTRL